MVSTFLHIVQHAYLRKATTGVYWGFPTCVTSLETVSLSGFASIQNTPIYAGCSLVSHVFSKFHHLKIISHFKYLQHNRENATDNTVEKRIYLK